MSGEISLYLNIILTMLVIGHIFRTNRPKYWIFIILISGILGAVIYFIFEILPELLGRPRAHRIIRQAKQNLNRKADIETLEKRQEFTGSIDATRHLANTLIENNRAEEAIAHYKNILTGIYHDDPDLLLGLSGSTIRPYSIRRLYRHLGLSEGEKSTIYSQPMVTSSMLCHLKNATESKRHFMNMRR